MAGGADAVDGRHPHVHEHHIGGERADQPGHLGPVARLADDLDVGLDAEDHAQAGPHQLVVVDQ